MKQIELDVHIVAPPARRPAGTIVRSQEAAGAYRWTMRRAWGSGPCIHWNLLNASDASDLRDDPTTLRMIGFSYRWGFGSMVVTNIYPFRSPDVRLLNTWRRGWSLRDLESHGGGLVWPYDDSALCAWLHNIDIVQKIVLEEANVHVAAWGNNANPDDVQDFLRGLCWIWDTVGPARHRAPADDGHEITINWKCLGVTGSGAPIHPLARGAHRIPDEAVLKDWKHGPAKIG